MIFRKLWYPPANIKSVGTKHVVLWIYEYIMELSCGLFENSVGIEDEVFEYY
jgi:hypothetical protein